MIDNLQEALDHNSRIVSAVPADRLHAPTPCDDWDVRALLNHLVAGNKMFTTVAGGGSADMALFEQDHVGDDAAGAYRRSADEAIAAWRSPGAMDEALQFGGMPGSIVIGLHLLEELVHGWDLARATGQDTTISPQLCEVAMAIARQMPDDQIRQPGVFGPEVKVGGDAPPEERLVAFLGRTP